jgi:hypothetical protein
MGRGAMGMALQSADVGDVQFLFIGKSLYGLF